MKRDQKQMREWMSQHRDFMDMMNKCQKEEKYCQISVNDVFFKGMLETYGYMDFPFQAGDFLSLWKRQEDVRDV